MVWVDYSMSIDANRTEESKLFFSIVTKQRCLFTILIYLGDLERYPVSQRMTFTRYREMNTVKQDKDWSKAEYYYKKASAINPHNGNPHNQLAIIATYALLREWNV